LLRAAFFFLRLGLKNEARLLVRASQWARHTASGRRRRWRHRKVP
jgi:hypothetical protein